MAKRLDLIAAKRQEIADDIAALRRNVRIVHRIGGHTTQDLAEEITFQQARLDLLNWCQTATDVQIQARRLQHHTALGVDGIAAKFGNVRGLPLEFVKEIALAEICDLALGTHPGIRS